MKWLMFAALVISTAAVAQNPEPWARDSRFQVRYASNLLTGPDSVINLINDGANGASLFGPGFGGPAGNICVNVYAFSPDEQLIACCSCLVTPNGLVSLSAQNDLLSNTLTGFRPNSLVIKLLASSTGAISTPSEFEGGPPVITPVFNGSSCASSAATVGTGGTAPLPVIGLVAFGSTPHSALTPPSGPPAGPFKIAETPFISATLSAAELASITNRCTNIIGNGTLHGQCRSCSLGGQGASFK